MVYIVIITNKACNLLIYTGEKNKIPDPFFQNLIQNSWPFFPDPGHFGGQNPRLTKPAHKQYNRFDTVVEIMENWKNPWFHTHNIVTIVIVTVAMLSTQHIYYRHIHHVDMNHCRVRYNTHTKHCHIHHMNCCYVKYTLH